jgi:hypothetical protein
MNKDLNDMLKATGMVHVERINADGKVVEQFDVKNLVVTTGKNFIASRMVGTSDPVMSHMAIGTGTVAPGASDIALGTQVGRVSLSGSSALNNSITYTATFPAGTGTGAITEAGIFNASSGGSMLCRTTFPVVNKQAGDTIAVTWVVTVS